MAEHLDVVQHDAGGGRSAARTPSWLPRTSTRSFGNDEAAGARCSPRPLHRNAAHAGIEDRRQEALIGMDEAWCRGSARPGKISKRATASVSFSTERSGAWAMVIYSSRMASPGQGLPGSTRSGQGGAARRRRSAALATRYPGSRSALTESRDLLDDRCRRRAPACCEKSRQPACDNRNQQQQNPRRSH